MAGKRTKAPTADDELGELFEGLDTKAPVKKATKAKPAAPKPKAGDAAANRDVLADLESQLGEKAPERPHTPRVREVKRTSTNTPPPPSATADASRKSAESAASHRASFTPSATSSEPVDSEKRAYAQQQQQQQQAQAQPAAGGGWWGGFLSTASAAMKQAEAAVKEIQQNEEAKKWADQVRGNVGALRGFGDELRHRALPTFTNILHTLAPPISSHERLLIHITHDLVGYPSLDPLIYGVFNRVMAQVEGGDLLVIQRGQESTLRSPAATSEKSGNPAAVLFSAAQQSAAGWRDGPWWRQADVPRNLGVVAGLIEGSKLCRANAEGYATEFFVAHGGGIEAAKQRALEVVSESNPVRSSDIFLSVQAIRVSADKSLFAGSSAEEKAKETSPVAEEDDDDDEVCFAVYLFDPVHEIEYATVSQRVPARWIRWLDAPVTPVSSGDEEDKAFRREFGRVPEEIREIIESGGVDPREWVAEWVEETLGLSVGVVAQKYVARRMGVGEGGIGKGKQKVETLVEDGGNEAARAGLI
ncbi:maintenance of telomere capping protein 1 [Dichotomopilus funicola]|uniref:Maintenance of telomere capping protein 1 n=1 Tax=Dichotomopilus funicola TaxID=1934379 RepID=A0AAN6V387_9PEZI|nr:maintenance of telomere capping protein 1 [Dichotomopilus funicola]